MHVCVNSIKTMKIWNYNACRAVKATSPWLNVILIVGILVRLSVPLMDGLIQSAASTKYVEVTHPVCYVSDKTL